MRKFLAAAAVLALFASPVLAQSGDVTAQANVLIPLSVTDDLRVLDFGDAFPGINKSIAYSDATSGKWRIDGEPGKQVSTSFTLPGNLLFGLDNVPITYSATDAAWHTSDAVGSATTFDPSAGFVEFLDGATGEIFVWIGGTIAPTATQPAGLYQATIVLDVVYTGL